jgi:hypothetical protein
LWEIAQQLFGWCPCADSQWFMALKYFGVFFFSFIVKSAILILNCFLLKKEKWLSSHWSILVWSIQKQIPSLWATRSACLSTATWTADSTDGSSVRWECSYESLWRHSSTSGIPICRLVTYLSKGKALLGHSIIILPALEKNKSLSRSFALIMIFRSITPSPHFGLLDYPGDKKRRPIDVIPVSPRKGREFVFFPGLRSDVPRFTSVSRQQKVCSVPSG